MNVQVTTDLIDIIKDELLSDNPCPEVLLDKIKADYSIGDENAGVLLSNIVRELNSKLFPPIRKLELMLTLNCNLRCSYCFEHHIRSKAKMSSSIARNAVDLLFDYSGERKNVYITLFGGEPTLNFPTLRYVTEYAENKAKLLGKNVHFNMTTNGVAISNEMLEFFSTHQIKVLLSIDGLQLSHDRFRIDVQGKGSYARVMDTMSRLKEKIPWIGVKMTIARENVSNICEEVRELYSLGVNQFLIGPATNDSWSTSDTDQYFEQMDILRDWYDETRRDDLRISEFEDELSDASYYGCQAARDNISVDVDGVVTGCSKIRSLERDEVIGRLGDVRYGLICLKKRMDFISCELLKVNCNNIGIKQSFFGGCFASNYEQSKDVFVPNLFDHDFSLRLRAPRDVKQS